MSFSAAATEVIGDCPVRAEWRTELLTLARLVGFFDPMLASTSTKWLIFEIIFVKLLIASRNGICCANRANPATVEKDAPTGKFRETHDEPDGRPSELTAPETAF